MKAKEFLSKEEIQGLTQPSDWLALRMVAFNWIAIFTIFYVVFQWTNPLTILLAIVLLAGRQLGLAVVMHDCGHRVMFKTSAINPIVGQYFAALPILSELHSFADTHLQHHRNAGTHDDPDLANYESYPVDKASFKRKVVRDLTGQTGFKLVRFIVMGAAGFFDREKRAASIPFIKILLSQLVLAAILAITMQLWLYLLWFIALTVPYMLVIRIRQIAEHAAVPDLFDTDARKHARTTIANWIERVFFAPNYVNYHMDHHYLASVPCYRLAEFHQLMKARGAYDETRITYGYWQVITEATAA